MAKIKLTKTAVESAKPQAKDIELRDIRCCDIWAMRDGAPTGGVPRRRRRPDEQAGNPRRRAVRPGGLPRSSNPDPEG